MINEKSDQRASLESDELNSEQLAQIAVRLFAKVSTDYKAFVPAQAVAIVRECKKNNWDPEQLKNALLEDKERIERLISGANASHGGLPDERRPKVGKASMKTIITLSFDFAAREMSLDDEQINYILNELHPHYRSGLINEEFFQRKVEQIVRESLAG